MTSRRPTRPPWTSFSGSRAAAADLFEDWLCEPWRRALRGKAHQAAIKRAALANGERFLEVAVGSGHTLLPLVLANPDGENHAVDLCEVRLRRCRARLERGGARNYWLARADARELPFAAESFDLLLCCYLLDSLGEADQDRALAEFLRVLRPYGRLVLTQMTRGSLAFHEQLARRMPMLVGGCRPVSLGPRLLRAGFRDVSQIVYKRLGFASELVRGVRI